PRKIPHLAEPLHQAGSRSEHPHHSPLKPVAGPELVPRLTRPRTRSGMEATVSGENPPLPIDQTTSRSLAVFHRDPLTRGRLASPPDKHCSVTQQSAQRSSDPECFKHHLALRLRCHGSDGE